MRRRGRSRVLTSVRTAARNFDLLLAIATPSTSAPALVETGMILIVCGGDRADLCSNLDRDALARAATN
jgi:hypothetical protein